MVILKMKKWFSRDFVVEDESGNTLGELDVYGIGIHARLSLDNREFVFKGSFRERSFDLLFQDRSIATARRETYLRDQFQLSYNGTTYRAQATAALASDFALWHGEERIGIVVPHSLTRLRAEFPDEFPVEFQVFLMWMHQQLSQDGD